MCCFQSQRFRVERRVRVRPFAVSMPSPSSNRAAPTRDHNNAGRSPTSASGLRKVPPPHTVDASHTRACVQHAQDAPQDDCRSMVDCKTLRPLEFASRPPKPLRCRVSPVLSSKKAETHQNHSPYGWSCVLRAACFGLALAGWPRGPLCPLTPKSRMPHPGIDPGTSRLRVGSLIHSATLPMARPCW